LFKSNITNYDTTISKAKSITLRDEKGATSLYMKECSKEAQYAQAGIKKPQLLRNN
jgi:hypothetical protein